MLTRFLAFAILCASLAMPAQARDLTGGERTALDTRVAEFISAMDSRNYATMLGMAPPRLHEALAKQAGVSVEELRATAVTAMTEMMKTVQIVGYTMGLDQAKYMATPDGTPYALIPTQTKVEMPDKRTLVADSYSVAFMDGETWYLLAIDDPSQLVLFREQYPSFTDVAFPQAQVSFEE